METSLSILTRAVSLNGFDLKEGEYQKIVNYLNLLIKWNQKINLTAHRKIEDLIYKDIIDSLYLRKNRLALAPKIRFYLDFGAGAGFLGIIESILDPNLKIGFLDSDRKKVNFIRQVYRELDLGEAIYLNIRGEQFPIEWKEYFEIITTRASLKIKGFLENVHYYVQNKGLLLFMAGKSLDLDGPETLDFKGLQQLDDINYTILPKNYIRKIFPFKKLSPTVSRETI